MARTSRRWQQEPNDVGTLWTMRRDDRTARCALMAWPDDWEIRIVVDGTILVAKRCERTDDAFQLAKQWKHRMASRRWRSVVPAGGCPPQPAL